MEVWCWGIAAAVLIGAELMTGTFYLLAVGAAAALGAVLAALGLELPTQLFIAAVACIVFVFAAHHWRLSRAHKSAPPMELDVGKRVTIATWNDDGTARVTYRGSTWDAVRASPTVPQDASLVICGTRGSVLVLSTAYPHPAN